MGRRKESPTGRPLVSESASTIRLLELPNGAISAISPSRSRQTRVKADSRTPTCSRRDCLSPVPAAKPWPIRLSLEHSQVKRSSANFISSEVARTTTVIQTICVAAKTEKFR